MCGISVTDIHVMEVEFLSNMRYSLLATPQEWSEWQRKLGFLEKLFMTSSAINVSLSEPTVVVGSPLSQFTASKSGFPQAHSSGTVILTYKSVGSPVLRTITNLVGSPFERCSPRYHLSSSPSYYRSIISPSNPLYYLSPFPIKSSSPLASVIHERPRNSQDYQAKHYAEAATPDGRINGKLKENFVSTVELGLRLEWPALTEADGIGLWRLHRSCEYWMPPRSRN